MNNFDNHIKVILANEGGYVWDVSDLGGETNFGISKKAYPWLDIKNLTKRDAKDIYYKDYWLGAKCDKLPDHLQLMHFDTAVNSGISRANKILQKSIGTVSVDGVIGAQTLSNVAECSLADYAIERALFYAKIVRSNKSQIKFLIGWIKRIKHVVNE